jgi:hypothetical protein
MYLHNEFLLYPESVWMGDVQSTRVMKYLIVWVLLPRPCKYLEILGICSYNLSGREIPSKTRERVGDSPFLYQLGAYLLLNNHPKMIHY